MTKKLTALTANTTPALTDLLLITDDPAGTPLSQKITVQNLRGTYDLTANLWNFNPADSTTYYWGAFPTVAAATSANVRVLKINKTGTITRAFLFWLVTGAGSAENVAFYIRKNDTSDTTLTTTANISASSSLTITGLSLSLTAGDVIEMKTVVPAMATNPTGVYFTCQMLLE